MRSRAASAWRLVDAQSQLATVALPSVGLWSDPLPPPAILKAHVSVTPDTSLLSLRPRLKVGGSVGPPLHGHGPSPSAMSRGPEPHILRSTLNTLNFLQGPALPHDKEFSAPSVRGAEGRKPGSTGLYVCVSMGIICTLRAWPIRGIILNEWSD